MSVKPIEADDVRIEELIEICKKRGVRVIHVDMPDGDIMYEPAHGVVFANAYILKGNISILLSVLDNNVRTA